MTTANPFEIRARATTYLFRLRGYPTSPDAPFAPPIHLFSRAVPKNGFLEGMEGRLALPRSLRG